MAELHVIHVITRFCEGGAARALEHLVRGLADEGVRSTLVHGSVSPGEVDVADRLDLGGAERIQLSDMQREMKPVSDWSAKSKLKALFGEKRADLVHTHTSKAGFLGRIAAREAGCPVVHSTHGNIFAREGRIPGVSGIRRTLFMFLERHAARKAARIFTLSHREVDDYLRLRIGRREQYAVLESPVDVGAIRSGGEARLAARKILGISEGAMVTAVVGRLTEEKGQSVAIAAFAAGAPGELWIIGEGPDRTRLEKQVDEAGLQSRVRFLGHRDDLRQWLCGVDCLCLPSHYEGQGLVVVEAFAAGIPVVATDVGGVAEVVDDGKSGLLVPPNSPEAIKNALDRIWSGQIPVQDLVSAATLAARRYDVPAVCKRLAAHYSEVVAGTS